jgi:small subunit ribosomal protein S17
MPRREKIATVVSDKMDKTRVVQIDERIAHPKYGKFQHHTTKFMAHDENNESHVGDTVVIREFRPLSRNKRWMISEIVAKSQEL